MAYVPPMLQHIKAQDDLKPGEGPVGLVLLPCRELWPQVEREVNVFEDYSRLQCAAACGGDGHGTQSFDGRDFVHIVVATPGRLLDLLDQKKTNLRRVTYMVVDEADQMMEPNLTIRSSCVASSDICVEDSCRACFMRQPSRACEK